MTEVIEFPNPQDLAQEVEQLRTELIAKIEERDELRYVICRNIEAKYIMLIGGLEYRAFELQFSYLYLKRKCEMIQAKKNRQEKVDLALIEATLDVELKEFHQRLESEMRRINTALEYRKGTVLPKEVVEELKKKYHLIIKAIHPDVHPNLTDSEKALFLHAVEAYKNGDIEAIRMIFDLVGEREEQTESSIKKLLNEKENLTTAKAAIEQEILKIKAEYPYTMKELLEKPTEVDKRKAELEQTISEYEKAIAIYEKKIQEMTE